MKYVIFATELIFIALWLFLGPSAWWIKILGVLVIIAISQTAHHFLSAR